MTLSQHYLAMHFRPSAWLLCALLSLLLAGCAAEPAPPVTTAAPATAAAPQASATPVQACPLTEPVVLTPPEDAAVLSTPQPEPYFVNADRSMWASAWGSADADHPWRAGEEGNKVGWFRPAGAALEVTGRRLDAPAPPLKVEAPCCYPTRFQASGLIFPTPGCWEVTARAGESSLSFVVTVEP